MLVLSRKKDEVIVIELEDNRTIEVMLVEIRGDKTRLGFSAPRTVNVHRREVYELVLRERLTGQRGDREPIVDLREPVLAGGTLI